MYWEYLLTALIFLSLNSFENPAAGRHDVPHRPFRIDALIDRRLCNNNHSVDYYPENCYTQKGYRHRCDSRNISQDQCNQAFITVHHLDYLHLLEVMAALAENDTIRRITVQFHLGGEDLSTIYRTVGTELDKFLTPRPWWTVKEEPYPWEVDLNKSNSNIVVERYHHMYEPYLRFLSTTQYFNDTKACRNAPMILGRSTFVHPGLGGVIGFYYNAHREIKFAVLNMYVSTSNIPGDNAAFITGTDCPNILNKWECAFLPLTYCPVPKIISDCHKFKCIRSIPDSFSFVLIFNASTENGSPLKSRSGTLWRHVESKGKSARNKIQESWYEASQKLPMVSYRAPYRRGNDSHYQPALHSEPEKWLFKFGFFLRQNAYFRSMVAQRINQMREEFNFPSNERCVAVHIRRGDRVPEQELKNFTAAALGKRQFKSLPLYNYGLMNGSVPFGSIRLHHIVKEAKKLVHPSVRTLFVVTDDEIWLNKENAELSQKTEDKWKIVYLRAPSTSEVAPTSKKKDPKDSSAYFVTRSHAGTGSGVLLHGSFMASKQCEAFVGHFGSAIAGVIYSAMCMGHNGTVGICPPAFNMNHLDSLKIRLAPKNA